MDTVLGSEVLGSDPLGGPLLPVLGPVTLSPSWGVGSPVGGVATDALDSFRGSILEPNFFLRGKRGREGEGEEGRKGERGRERGEGRREGREGRREGREGGRGWREGGREGTKEVGRERWRRKRREGGRGKLEEKR